MYGASETRLDSVLQQLLPLIGQAIVANGIAPPNSPRFPQGWPISTGNPDMTETGSVKYATDDGGYIVAVNAVPPERQSVIKCIEPPFLTAPDGTIRQEVARRLQRVQVTAWAATASMRNGIADAVQSVLGTDIPRGQWLYLPDLTSFRMQYASGPRRVDETINNSQIKRMDFMLDVDYGIMGPVVSFTDIEDTEAFVTLYPPSLIN